MIINCEKCGSKFNLDENLLNEKGSKVRCSVCKSIFTVFPPEPEEEEDDFNAALEETVDLDSPPVFDEDGGIEADTDGIEADDDFDKAFENALNEDLQDEGADEEEKAEPAPEPPKEKKKSKRPGLLFIILIILFVVLLGAAAVYLFAPGLLPDGTSGMQPIDQQTVVDPGSKKLEIVDYSDRYIHTDDLGQLFIIKGRIVNNYPEARSYILIKGTLEDENRNPILRKLVYAGNIFSEHELKDITIEEIDERMNLKSGKDNSNMDIAPQDSVPFMIIFNNLPDSLSEYVVEAVSSSPAQ